MQTITTQNDEFRRGNPAIPGSIVTTATVANLPHETVQEILEKVQQFNAFTEDNDPYGEHDFGKITHAGEVYLWKIDYYDKSLTKHSEDKTDLTKTVRVLTIMHSSDY